MESADQIVWPALAIMVLVATWLGWRHVSLRRALRRFETDIQSARAPRRPDRQLASLSRVVRTLMDGLNTRSETLTAERDRLAAVLDQMTDGVLIADAQGTVRYSNPAAGQVLDSPETLGRSITEVLRDHRLVHGWELSRSTQTIQSESVEVPTSQKYLQLISMPDGHAGGSLLVVQDLTQLRRLELIRRDFVANLSHELRTPLASIKALAETLLGGAVHDPDAGPRFLQSVVTEVDALARMSEELLELSAIESGKAELILEPCDPRALVEAAAGRMRVQAERAGLQLRLELPDGLPYLRADPVRLEQVLVSLIHNAVKFTPPGGEVVLSAREAPIAPGGATPTAIEISIRDTGQGIPADDLPRIFERFYRADKARSRGGAGLGLSIARHIVEAHGGRIWAESAEGRGSKFTLIVPTSDAGSPPAHTT